jgi:hypothetical protein
MVKLGVYLLARLDPAFDDWPLWEQVLKTVGIGAPPPGRMVLALRERDLKRILAWSTVSALGTLVMLVGLPGDGAGGGGGRLAAGARAVQGAAVLRRRQHRPRHRHPQHRPPRRQPAPRMPWTAPPRCWPALSMAGMPLSFGFVAKDVIDEAKSAGDVSGGRLPVYVGLVVGQRHAGPRRRAGGGRGHLALPPLAGARRGVAVRLSADRLGALSAAVLRDRLVLLLATGLVGYGSAMCSSSPGRPTSPSRSSRWRRCS